MKNELALTSPILDIAQKIRKIGKNNPIKGGCSESTTPKLLGAKKPKFKHHPNKDNDIKHQPAFCGAGEQHSVVRSQIMIRGIEGRGHMYFVFHSQLSSFQNGLICFQTQSGCQGRAAK